MNTGCKDWQQTLHCDNMILSCLMLRLKGAEDKIQGTLYKRKEQYTFSSDVPVYVKKSNSN